MNLYRSLEYLSLPHNANGIESKIKLVLKTTNGQLDLMSSSFTYSLKEFIPVYLKGNKREITHSLYDIFANKINLQDVVEPYRETLRNTRLAVMNAFPRDVQDFINGRAIDSTTGRLALGLQTDGQRRGFINEIIEDLNKMTEPLKEIPDHFLSKQDLNEFTSEFNWKLTIRRFVYRFTYDDFKKSLFDGPLAQSLNEFRTTLTGLVPARYMIAGGAVIGVGAYFTSTVEASEIESTDDEDITESNVHVYISMTAEELQAQKDHIVSDRQLLLYEQNRDTQRNSRRPSF